VNGQKGSNVIWHKHKDLPGYYTKRSLLKGVIMPEDIAAVCLAFVSRILNEFTGSMLDVAVAVATALTGKVC
jgi:hypothetical protein